MKTFVVCLLIALFSLWLGGRQKKTIALLKEEIRKTAPQNIRTSQRGHVRTQTSTSREIHSVTETLELILEKKKAENYGWRSNGLSGLADQNPELYQIISYFSLEELHELITLLKNHSNKQFRRTTPESIGLCLLVMTAIGPSEALATLTGLAKEKSSVYEDSAFMIPAAANYILNAWLSQDFHGALTASLEFQKEHTDEILRDFQKKIINQYLPQFPTLMLAHLEALPEKVRKDILQPGGLHPDEKTSLDPLMKTVLETDELSSVSRASLISAILLRYGDRKEAASLPVGEWMLQFEIPEKHKKAIYQSMPLGWGNQEGWVTWWKTKLGKDPLAHGILEKRLKELAEKTSPEAYIIARQYKIPPTFLSADTLRKIKEELGE